DTKAAAMNSNRALAELGPDIQWQHSYISENKTHCVYLASNEEILRKHAEMIGSPILSITRVEDMWDPTTGEG
ncbi:MAG: nickel-binding protein, partial [Bacteroidota bacterium]